MTTESHVDGNALGGLFIEVFGREMTDSQACCANCGAVNAMGALKVYRSGPGDVVRCPACNSVLMVAASLPDRPRVYVGSLLWMESPS